MAMRKIGGFDQNHPAVEYAVRVTLHVAPLLLWVVGQTVSWPLAVALLAAGAVLLWKNFDYDFREFPLLIQFYKKMIIFKRKIKLRIFKEIRVDYIHFSAMNLRFNYSCLSFTILCFFSFLLLREFNQNLFYNIVISDSIFIEFLIQMDDFFKNYITFFEKNKDGYLDMLKISSKSEKFYFSHSPDFLFTEISVVAFNWLICFVFFEVMQISIFIKNFIYKSKNRKGQKNQKWLFIYLLYITPCFIIVMPSLCFAMVGVSLNKFIPGDSLYSGIFLSFALCIFTIMLVSLIYHFEYFISHILLYRYQTESVTVFDQDKEEWVWTLEE